MRLPFDADQFFAVFARYNIAVWPAQIVLTLAALVAVILAATAFGVLFALEGVLLLAIATWRGRLRFAWTRTLPGIVGAALIAYALVVYPTMAYALGHRFPAAPTFGLPCPTAILTLGLLAWAVPPRSWGVLVISLLWSAVGASAAAQLGVWEDLGLVAAGGLILAVLVSRPRAASGVSTPSAAR
jgi:Family of unknown function (DUF6064)